MLSHLTPIIERLAADIRDARRFCCLTGAGVSAESGVPTFRGAGGLWDGQRLEEVATPEAFARDPATVWAFYHQRRVALRRCSPNPGHRALAELERRRPETVLVTQNIDGLHQRAGSQRVVELHGNIWTVRCTQCAQESTVTDADFEGVPSCPACGGLQRPAVVWFGEPLPLQAFQRAEQAARGCEVLLLIGTSAKVHPAARLPMVARLHGARLVEINPAATPLSAMADVCLPGPAGVILPRLVSRLTGSRTPDPRIDLQ